MSGDDAQSFRDLWAEFKAASLGAKLKWIGALALVVPFLAILFLIGFFLFGGWAVFDEHLPDWLERLFTFLLIVLAAWAALKPVFDRWSREDDPAS